jgi:hypothetical protein
MTSAKKKKKSLVGYIDTNRKSHELRWTRPWTSNSNPSVFVPSISKNKITGISGNNLPWIKNTKVRITIEKL